MMARVASPPTCEASAPEGAACSESAACEESESQSNDVSSSRWSPNAGQESTRQGLQAAPQRCTSVGSSQPSLRTSATRSSLVARSRSVTLQRVGSALASPTDEAILRAGRGVRDARGVVHDLQELRRKRHAAVLRGMRYMHAFLLQNDAAPLFAIGDDAVCVFFEIWYTSADSLIRANAKGVAIELLKRYEDHIVRGKQRLLAKECRDIFFELMFLSRCYVEMGLEVEPLLLEADRLYQHEGFQDEVKLFGVSVAGLAKVTVADWTVLIMNVMIMDFNNRCLFQNRWPTRLGLQQAFAQLRSVPLEPPGETDAFFHSYYLATHIAFAISAYTAIKTVSGTPTGLPTWLCKYIWESIKYNLRRARRQEKNPSIYVDIDAIAEAIDVFRCCGLNDANHPLICEATVYLMTRQRRDGSWPNPHAKPKFYDTLHPTWVVTQSLRDRNFEFERQGNIKWDAFMARCLRVSGLRKRTVKIVYKKGKESSADLPPQLDSVSSADACEGADACADGPVASSVEGAAGPGSSSSMPRKIETELVQFNVAALDEPTPCHPPAEAVVSTALTSANALISKREKGTPVKTS
eukprot:TRINITY_DN61473_c0_g1_i1.p1 TRINITY_DN61473_c0_g1~~TRINITY_DN61473_c0_g1_i1.p1  ORF type:complete len:580 (+),score=81.71 TRINITY_DN61473_c0_g1_i1:3-1742(+)